MFGDFSPEDIIEEGVAVIPRWYCLVPAGESMTVQATYSMYRTISSLSKQDTSFHEPRPRTSPETYHTYVVNGKTGKSCT